MGGNLYLGRKCLPFGRVNRYELDYTNMIRTMLHAIDAPGLHEFLDPFFPHLGQYPDDHQFQDLVRQVLVKVRITPDVQFQSYFPDEIPSEQTCCAIEDIWKQGA